MKKSIANPFKGVTVKDWVLSLQHMFAMFGATVTVPMVVGMSVPLALLSAGVGTIIFYFLTKKKVPVFLGSSFAFMPGLITVYAQAQGDSAAFSYNAVALAAMLALVVAGLIYVIFSFVIKKVGVHKIKKLFPPIVVGPVIIVIGMNLAGSIFWNNIVVNAVNVPADAWKYWTTAIITALTIVIINAFAKPKSFLKVVPVVLGFLVGYIYGMAVGIVDLDPNSATFVYKNTAKGIIVIFQQAKEVWGFWGAWNELNGALIGTAMISIAPIAVVTFMEHLGDISANSTVCNKDFMVDPGLNRTVLGDGVATIASAFLGGPANTTYGENTAVLAITKNYNPRNIFIAACFAVVLGLFVPFGEFISGIPGAVVGGACIVLFGMISANGLRALVDGKVDFGNTKNMLVVAITLSVGLGLGALSLAGSITNNHALKIGFEVSHGQGFVEISPLAIATLLAIILNLVIPNRKETSEEEETASENAQFTLMANVNEAEEIAKEEAENTAAECECECTCGCAEHAEAATEPEQEKSNE